MCERAQIAQHGTFRPCGYNLTSGGDGGSDRQVSAEQRAVASVKWKKAFADGRIPWLAASWEARRGTKLTQEQKDRIGETLKKNPDVMAQVRALASENHRRATGRKITTAARAARIIKRRAAPSATMKLTAEDVVTIRARLFSGISGTDLARVFGVTRTTISRIKCNKAWSDVSPDRAEQLAAVPNSNVKLTPLAVSEIRAALVAGGSGPALAERYGVTINTISSIRTGNTWPDVAAEALAELKKRGDPQVKLTENRVAEIKIALMLGERVSDLGRQCGVNAETVRDIKAGRSWRRVMPANLLDFILPMGA